MRSWTTALKTAAAGLAAASVLPVAPASAEPTVKPFGGTGELVEAGGAQIVEYTVQAPQPSDNQDGIWFVDVIARATRGTTTPVISNFKARGADGKTVSVTEGDTTSGIGDGPIVPSSQATGRLYFPSPGGGRAPDSVIYTEQGKPRLVWKNT